MARKLKKATKAGPLLIREVPMDVLNELMDWARELEEDFKKKNDNTDTAVSRSSVALTAIRLGIEAHKTKKVKTNA